LELRKATNEVVIGPADKTFKKSLTAVNLNWIAIRSLDESRKVYAKVRSTQTPVPVTIAPGADGAVYVEFDELQKSIAPGQSIVFYENDTVLGGGGV